MFWRALLLGLAAGLLCGCASERAGFDYAGVMQRVGPPKPGQSRVVVLQPKAGTLNMAYCVCDMKLDDAPIGKLKPGTYVYADRPAGRHQLTAAESLFPGETRRDITIEAGRTYFFLTKTSQQHDNIMGATVVGGLAGMAVASAVTASSGSSGPVDFFPVDEAAARTTMAELQLAE